VPRSLSTVDRELLAQVCADAIFSDHLLGRVTSGSPAAERRYGVGGGPVDRVRGWSA